MPSDKNASGKSRSTAGTAKKRPAATSKHNVSKKKAMSAEDKTPETLPDGMPTDKSLETVRDILFGAQVKQANERDRQLEKLILDKATELQKELAAQVKQIENTFAKLENRLAREAEKTAQQIATRFDEVAADITSLDAQTKTAQQDMFDTLTSEREKLEQSALSWNEALAKELETVHQQLLHSKLDRSTLAQQLTNMAASIAPETGTKG